jgi:hypothetical protein
MAADANAATRLLSDDPTAHPDLGDAPGDDVAPPRVAAVRVSHARAIGAPAEHATYHVVTESAWSRREVIEGDAYVGHVVLSHFGSGAHTRFGAHRTFMHTSPGQQGP